MMKWIFGCPVHGPFPGSTPYRCTVAGCDYVLDDEREKNSLAPSVPITQEHRQFYHSCFISYCSQDERVAKRIYTNLQDKGVRCWFSLEDLKIGDEFWPEIEESIRVYDKLLLILSKHSLTNSWVEKEVTIALAEEREYKRTVLLPIRLDDAIMETQIAWALHIRRTRHIGDFRNWQNQGAYRRALARLLRDLTKEGGKNRTETRHQT